MNILVAIANYGRTNDQLLSRVLEEYRSMRYDVDIVVLSNIPKDFGSNVQVLVGLPNRDPWSLPFGHKRVFAERLADYDLFIYSEDDILITARNICAFLRATDLLPEDEIAGFLRCETGSDGKVYFTDAQAHYHWDSSSVRPIGDYTFASFTNEHAACYVLTQHQLRRAIASGGFLVNPHEGKYGLLESAATDPYTQCGFRKMIPISHLDDFVVSHLSNKYAGRIGLETFESQRQIRALMDLPRNGAPPKPLFDVEARTFFGRWSKYYYEPCQYELLSLIPNTAQSVLSIGCGWGATEGCLVNKGIRVVGVPLDSVIAACAEARGVEIIEGDFRTARERLKNERFDCVLLSNILHLVRDPVAVLSSFTGLLSPEGVALASVPNLAKLPTLWRRMRYPDRYGSLESYEKSRVHLTTQRVLGGWFRRCRLRVDRILYVLPERWKLPDQILLGIARGTLASELVVGGQKI